MLKFTMRNNYRQDIQALRGMAVICVVANHINKEILPNGFLGVNIFFIISGYVITPLILKIFEIRTDQVVHIQNLGGRGRLASGGGYF